MKKYCIHCNQEIIYNVIEREETAVMRGKKVKYIYKSAICSNCGCELYVPQIHDGNHERLETAYKKQEDIISIEEINDILEMYHIEGRELACLLGFEEFTVTRFLDGKLPSPKSSAILKSVLNSTSKMREYVENNTDDSLKSACEKVLEAIEKMERSKRLLK